MPLRRISLNEEGTVTTIDIDGSNIDVLILPVGEYVFDPIPKTLHVAPVIMDPKGQVKVKTDQSQGWLPVELGGYVEITAGNPFFLQTNVDVVILLNSVLTGQAENTEAVIYQ